MIKVRRCDAYVKDKLADPVLVDALKAALISVVKCDGGQSFMVNYRVDDLDAMLAQLRSAGVRVTDEREDSESGRFGWAYDGEGNRFELWQPA